LPGDIVGYFFRNFSILRSVLYCCWVSQPSSNVARKIRISQELQSY